MNGLTVTDVRVLPGDSAFLLDDGTTAILYDTGFGFTGFGVADRIKEVLSGRPLDYIFLTHSHYDHALGSAYILERWPEARVVAGEHAARVFTRPGALAVMADLDGKMAARCGVNDYPFLGDRLRVDTVVSDGDVITAGGLSFETVALPGHTKCSIGFYCPEHRLLLGCETLGVYDGKESIVLSCLVGWQMTLDSIARLERYDIKRMLAPHLGLLSEEQTAWFLAHAADSNREGAEFILRLLREGVSEPEICNRFFDRFIHGHNSEIYPEDAARLNISIMTGLIRKELLQR